MANAHTKPEHTVTTTRYYTMGYISRRHVRRSREY